MIGCNKHSGAIKSNEGLNHLHIAFHCMCGPHAFEKKDHRVFFWLCTNVKTTTSYFMCSQWLRLWLNFDKVSFAYNLFWCLLFVFLCAPVDSRVRWTGATSWRRRYQRQLHRDPEPRPICCRPQCWQWILCLSSLPDCQRDWGHTLCPADQ